MKTYILGLCAIAILASIVVVGATMAVIVLPFALKSAGELPA